MSTKWEGLAGEEVHTLILNYLIVHVYLRTFLCDIFYKNIYKNVMIEETQRPWRPQINVFPSFFKEI